MELENMETLELAKPEAKSKKKKSKKMNKKKKNKKNKKKKNKKTKNRKNKKRRKKKNKKGRNRKSNSKGRSGARAQERKSDCTDNINKYLQFLSKQVANLDKQILRAGRHKSVTLKKTGKKGDFATALSSAAKAAGGNISAPKCGKISNSS